jgi:hypothetical protein
MTLKKKLAIGLSAAIVVAAVAAYETVVPNHYAAAYTKDLHSSTGWLQRSLKDTADSSLSQVFAGDEKSTLATNKKDIDNIQSKISNSRAGLKDFQKTTNGLKKLPLTGYFGAYHQAKITQNKANAAIKEAQKQLDAYQQLITFSKDANSIDSRAAEKLFNFGENGSITLAQNIAGLKNNAAATREEAQAYQTLKPPANIQKDSQQINVLTAKLADGLDAYAKALEDGDQDAVKAAASGNEQYVNQMNDVNRDMLKILGSDSSILKKIKDLPKLVEHL